MDPGAFRPDALWHCCGIVYAGGGNAPSKQATFAPLDKPGDDPERPAQASLAFRKVHPATGGGQRNRGRVPLGLRSSVPDYSFRSPGHDPTGLLQLSREKSPSRTRGPKPLA